MSRELLEQYKQETGLSQNKIAKELGLTAGVISPYLAGKYTGDVQAIDKKVRQLVKRKKAKQAEGVHSDFVFTETAKSIMKNCFNAHTMAELCIVVGDAGLGKTMALKQYAKTQENVILLETDGTYSPKVILQELCEVLNIEGLASRSNHVMMKAIINKLTGSDSLIIIDEAELLSLKSLELIRRIHDKAGVGVVLAGLHQLRANLQGRNNELRQLYSRVGGHLDIKKALPEEDIRLLASELMGTDEFNDRLNHLSHGNARRLNKLCCGVIRVAKQNNIKVSEDVIDECTKLLVG